MGALKRFWDRINGTVQTTGTSTAYVYTPLNTNYPTAYVNSETFRFLVHVTCSNDPTIDINGRRAESIQGQSHHLRRRFRRDRRLAGLAGLVAQQTLDPALGKALLPPPHRRTADAEALRNLLRRAPIRRGEHDARPFHVFARPVAVGGDRPSTARVPLRSTPHILLVPWSPSPTHGAILHILTARESFL